MKIAAIIPARFASTRFPGKPLHELAGKTMIQRVYEQAEKCRHLRYVCVATDHDGIFEHVQSFGGNVVMTESHHVSGTDRCNEAMSRLKDTFDYIVNVQGDEPFIKPEQISLLCEMLDGNTEIATLVKPIQEHEQLFNSNIVKAVVGYDFRALYFSRSPIPHIRNKEQSEWIATHTFYKHIGMYAYRSDILTAITKLSVGALEAAESLEQLRWLENGYGIKVAVTQEETIGIDTPADVDKALAYLSSNG